MATLISPLPVEAAASAAARRLRLQGLLQATVLTPLVLLIHGYHPFAEDGGIYLAGVKRLLHPELYPRWPEFVLAPMRFSLFAPLVAALARMTHLGATSRLPLLVFGLHLATVWATLYAASVLARRCWSRWEAQVGAVMLLACWVGMPVAGTSLLFMDPYLTARSFSTPCAIAALVGAIDFTEGDGLGTLNRSRMRGLLVCAGSIVVAGLVHPLMATYAALASALVVVCRLRGDRQRSLGRMAVAGLWLGAAAMVYRLAPAEPAEYLPVALTRSYWFLSRWRWYEDVGIVAPVLLLMSFARRRLGDSGSVTAPVRALASAAIGCACLVTATGLLFCRIGAAHHLIAALQPMRGLQFVYLTLFLLLGAELGERVLRRSVWRYAVAIPLLGFPLFAASRHAAPGSAHIELPGRSRTNPWVEAFLWVRAHTPVDALFALPADYILLGGEDAQCFRAVSERSALPDNAKDGGEAAVAPALAGAWTIGHQVQASLATDDDGQRRAKLKPLGVTWIVLPAASATQLACPFRNSAAKVCRLD